MAVPLPAALSGSDETRLIIIDKSLFYLVTGALVFLTEYEPLVNTGSLDVETARLALSAMLDAYLEGSKDMIVAPIGMVSAFASAIPSKWLACDGQLYLKSAYPELSSALPAVYTEGYGLYFQIPNLQGRTAIGVGTSPDGLHNYLNGVVGGVDSVTLTQAQIPAHTHTQKNRAQNGTQRTISVTASSNAGAEVNAGETSSIGGGGSHENRMPFFVLNYAIYAGR